MRYISADQIFTGKKFLSNGSVLVIDDNHIIADILDSGKINEENIEHFDGIICPGFINTHCHLELSHLKNTISQKTGIVNFALDVIKKRNLVSIEQQNEAMLLADKLMYEQGIVAVGDISNSNISKDVKSKSSIYYHTFVELIGLNPQKSESVFNYGLDLLNDFKTINLSCSLAPHAPYTASTKLIELISNECFKQKKPTSIHNQESIAENDFFKSKSGDFLKLYNTLNISIDFFNATNESSLQSILNSFNKEVNSLLVHNTFSSIKDVIFAKKNHKKLFWCLCANANLYIENTLPNIDLLISENFEITLGTDSLASNNTLSIIEEINTIKKHFPNITLESLLKMATYNGAKFLGIENKFGVLEKGRNCELNLIKNPNGMYIVSKIR
jgi:cytosine/adenosine deaminase-related metal-dependent hydrolase